MPQLKITAHLATPLASRTGDVPQLDALLQYEMAKVQGLLGRCDRRLPLPEMPRIPLMAGRIGGLQVYHCSEPILPAHGESVERYTRILDTGHAELLDPAAKRSQHVTTAGPQKSYRLPLRVHPVDRVVWFAEGKRKRVRDVVRRVTALGCKRSQGYGIVARWDVDRWDGHVTWFAPHQGASVLMRRLPVCDDLPDDLIGCRRDYGACQPPYWHPQRYREIVVPC